MVEKYLSPADELFELRLHSSASNDRCLNLPKGLAHYTLHYGAVH